MELSRQDLDYRNCKEVTSQGRVVTSFSDLAHQLVVQYPLWGNHAFKNVLQQLPSQDAALFQASLLRQLGDPLSDDQLHLNILMKQYWLCSTICIVDIGGKLFWATKSGRALRALFPELESEADRSNLGQQVVNVKPSSFEIEEKRFAVQKVLTGKSGYRLEAAKVSADNRIMPYFSLHTYAHKLIRHLLQHQSAVITFRQAKQSEKLRTSLNPSLLYPHFNPAQVRGMLSLQHWHRGNVDIGFLPLPDLDTGLPVYVPLHKITAISPK